MTVLVAILPIVSRSSTLALDLYNLNPTSPDARKGWVNIAKAVSSFAVAVKQTGTIIKEDDRLPSHEAIEALEDVINQAQTILSEVESTLPLPDSYDDESVIIERLQYLTAHFDALRATLSVMLQTLHTSQSIMWARTRQTVSPQKAATAVANEKSQLETLIIEQQISILSASRFYGLCRSRSDARLLMEQDSSQSLVPVIADGGPQPVRLLRYQDKFIASLEMSDSADEAWLPTICGIAKSQVEHLLERWTCLRQFEDSLREAERRRQARRRESLQPTVESDSEDETHLGGCGVKTVAPTPRLPNGIQPLFTETTSLPIPVSQPKFGPTAPLSPASSYGISPRFSGNSLAIPGGQPGSIPVSPRTSISNPPVEAAAAVEAQEEDEDVQLEIPWALRTRKHFWKYVDSRVVDSNCDLPPSVAFSERNCWTEILASWVCKEAIKEAGYQCTQVQKERRDGRRTKLETCFCIEQPLTFEQVHLLVERTVEIFRRTRPPSPPPRSSHFQNDPLSVHSKGTPQDRDRTPVAKQHPPLERSTTSFPFPPPPPPLDRSVSLPNSVPKYPPQPRIATGHLSIPQPYTYQEPYSPQPVPHSPQATAYFPQVYPQPNPYPHMMPIQHQAPNAAYPGPPSPLRQSIRFDANGNANPPPAYSSDLSTSGTSDSDSVVRSRKQRSRSRDRRSSPRNKKKSHGHNSGTLGALMGVGGLTALLDGLSGL